MEDTIKLLKECNSGTKMASTSIQDVLEYAEDKNLIHLLNNMKKRHDDYGDKLHEYLLEIGADDKEPNPIAKGMSWMKINAKMMTTGDDHTIADLMTDGCDMGIKSLTGYINEYHDADAKARDLANELIAIESEMREDLREYL